MLANGLRSITPASRYVARKPDSASSREKPSVVCVRSFVPNEKKSAYCGDLAGAQRRARQLDHRPDRVRELTRRALQLLRDDVLDQRAHSAQLLGEGHQRDHDLDLRRLALPAAASAPRTIARTCIA